MSGREQFARYKRVINLGSIFFKLIPNFVLIRFLAFFDSLETKEAILLRYLYLKKNAAECGDNIFIGKYVTLKNVESLELGSNISIQAYCYLDAFGGIKIENEVSIANHTSLISFDHTWDDKEMPIKYNPIKKKRIHIERDVWIGNGCRILSGVIIRSRSIIAAGAIVNKEVSANTLVGGVPAKKIKEI